MLYIFNILLGRDNKKLEIDNNMVGARAWVWCAVRNRIKELRARYDMTQEDLARIVGVRRETILHMEKGRYNPSLVLAHRVAVALRTTIDELFMFDEAT